MTARSAPLTNLGRDVAAAPGAMVEVVVDPPSHAWQGTGALDGAGTSEAGMPLEQGTNVTMGSTVTVVVAAGTTTTTTREILKKQRDVYCLGTPHHRREKGWHKPM